MKYFPKHYTNENGSKIKAAAFLGLTHSFVLPQERTHYGTALAYQYITSEQRGLSITNRSIPSIDIDDW